MYIEKSKDYSSSNKVTLLPKEEQLVWLMEEYGDMVIRLAYTYVKQQQLAEDISQEVFISCYQNLNRFQNRSTYKTWLYRITVNKCKDYLKSWSFKNIQYKDIISSFLMSTTPSADSAFIYLEEKEDLFEKVLTLPVKFREIIILHYYEDLSVNDISELLGLNLNTVKTRLHRADIH
ncbi:sigma-70 family RNA polymerase sigma factor [Cytobacillus sp. FJAT-54145]|uniref:Sigma-70 family RNA polymerase sigma factor n=1 Tax=Cytobacillus spartinae TaxID=3299023 RepID=A0ABW6KCK2_9BACI